MPVVPTTRRFATTFALIATSLVLSGPAAEATDDRDPSLVESVEDILDVAVPGLPLRVGITSSTPDGPQISSTLVNSLSDAATLIRAAQGSASTLAVGLAQPVSVDGSRDTLRRSQWALDRFKAAKVWRASKGKGVVVAVVDTGVYRRHPDLKGHVLRGYDVVDPGTPAGDQNGHGTHVAGIISAVTRNGQGIAGLARGAKILPVRVLDANGSGDTVDVAEGVVWAVNHGADVINMSLGATQGDANLRAAVAYAARKNVVVIAAAGNDSCASPSLLFPGGSDDAYPALYADVVGVGSIDRDGGVSSFSSCGSWVDVVAPGGGIMSTMIRNSRVGCASSELYCTLSGTSMATPYTSAAAALSIEKAGSGWKASTVRSLLASTADDMGQRGRDDASGAGLINPRRLIKRS